MFDKRSYEKVFLTIAGGFVLLYCVIVLAFVSTAADLRLRVLLVDDELERSNFGVIVRETPGIENSGAVLQPGDQLVQIGDVRLRSFNDFIDAVLSLRRVIVHGDGLLKTGVDPSTVLEPLPPVVENDLGVRMARVEFVRDGHTLISWVVVQSVPLGETLLTFLWFLLQLAISALGALAIWYRPFDRPARLFFAMCVVTLGAFVGGFHWWIIAGSLVLNIPFVACALLVPVVSLHFFLSYPRRALPFIRFPRSTYSLLYVVPAIAFIWMVSLLIYTRWVGTFGGEGSEQLIVDGLKQLRDAIYVYMSFAAGCFVAILGVLASGYLRTSNPVERNQLKWMFWGGACAIFPVGYTLYLALFDRVEFALGKARLSMFLASLSFMLAYAVAMLRFKLMLLDQIVSKGMRYYAVSLGLTGAFAGLISLCSITANFWNSGGSVFPRVQQVVVLGTVLAIGVVSLLWGRDRLQQLIDRSFYREKYQLDKALQRMNRAVEHVVDRETLARRMIGSCRDVLRADRIGVYLRDAGRPTFSLITAEGASDWLSQIVASDELLQTLKQESAVIRSVAPLGSGLSTGQQMLRSLRVDLMYAFESDGELAGIVALGPKHEGTGYTAEDLTFLNALGQLTSVALHSVKVHQDISRLNEELQLKVEKIEDQKRMISMLQQEIRTSQDEESSVKAEPVAEEFQRGQIRGDSPAIRQVLETVRKVATSESSVLINGASGTGKELLAHAIHVNSPRRSGPMISVHCAALSPGLLESELFGHVKGSFTGAHKDRVGRFELANGGTLFLDEIGDISLETQVKLLRVLQTRQFEPVGGARTVNVDVRLITATHQDLRKLIAEGKFREDLFYRLNVINIRLPSLAERKEDILELSLHFLKQSSNRLGKRLSHIDDAALEALKRHSWPGNIRELENVIERAVVLADGDTVLRSDLPMDVLETREPIVRSVVAKGTSVSRVRRPDSSEFSDSDEFVGVGVPQPASHEFDEFTEQDSLRRALQAAGGNKAEAARMLGMPRSTFFSKLRKYRINKPR